MLKISTNDCEKGKAYLRMGDAKYKSMEYSESLFYLKKADSFFYNCDLNDDSFVSNFIQMLIYKDLKIDKEFNNAWNKLKKISNKICDPSVRFMFMQANAMCSEKKRDYKDAIVYRKQISDYVENILKLENNDSNKLFLAMSYSYLSYDYLKNNDYNEAVYYHDKINSLVKNIPINDNYLLDLEYLVKAMIFAENKQYQESKEWFDKAYRIAKIKKLPNSILKINEERLNYGIYDKVERQKFYDEINEINQQKLIEFNSYSVRNLEKNQKKYTTNRNLFIVFIVFISILLLLIVYMNRVNRKKIKRNFEKTIANLENNHHNRHAVDLDAIDRNENNSSIMSIKKEKELLMKLDHFEKRIEYTSKKFTFSNFISSLETNSKYANYIIKKHRNKNFNDYLNELRIKYILEKLYNNPEYLNYKISYLAEISGFSTHSHFTKVFKSITKISPSEFIKELSNKQKLN
ncbi:helix-turn-helix domain-containing protein [Empedobacter brevis]|uniref:helix-turn-helix domain-containing protein n=1 Tax=Empedobacter brevis TaxID=247 RepID=UPI0039AF52DE